MKCVWALISSLAMLGGCASDECDVPPPFAYTCAPQSATANVCVGGPTVGAVAHDPDKNYEVGCFAGPGSCVDGSLQIEHQCQCISGFTGTTWSCH